MAAKHSRSRRTSKKRSSSEAHGAAVFIVDAATSLSLLGEVGRKIAPVIETVQRSKPIGSALPVFRGISDLDVSRAVEYALKRVPVYLRAAARPPLTADERDSLRREVTGFLKEWPRSTPIDARLLRTNAEVAGFRGRADSQPLFLADDHRLILASDEHTTLFGGLGGGPEEAVSPTVAKGAFAVDILLEVMGLVLGLVGLSVPKSGQNAIVRVADKMLKKPGIRNAFARLLRGLRSHNWAEIIHFLEALEQEGNLTELFAHVFANLSKWDYVVTVVKVLAWLAAAAAGPAAWAAFAAKLVSLGADFIGLGLKIPEMEKLQW